MAGTIDQLPSVRVAEHQQPSSALLWTEPFREPWRDNSHSKPGLLICAGFRQKESLWVDGWYDPTCVPVKLPNQGSAPLCPDLSTRKGSASAARQHWPQDEGTAFIAALRACSKHKDLYRGTCLHDDILRRGLLDKCSDALVTMYAKCGQLGKAKSLLDMHKSSDVITWTALIAGYARDGQGQNALECFDCMQRQGIIPDAVTFVCLLKACATIGATDKGKEIHDVIAMHGLLQDNVVLVTALVDMYAKCGALAKAHGVLEKLPFQNVAPWNALIAGYAQEGQGEQALNCFKEMQHEGILPDAVTYTCILKACGAIGDLGKGTQIHDEISRQGLLKNDIVLGTALVDMYAKCGALSQAKCVLEELSSHDVVLWSAVIAGYAQEGQGEQALDCFECMKREGILPNAVTYASLLKACASIGAIDKGKQIHDEVVRQGLLQNNFVLGAALVDMYAKCGALAKAQHVLDGLPSRDVVSWSVVIARYAQEGQGEQALNCFKRMQHEGILPNAVTILSVLNVCSHRGLVEEGYTLFVNMRTNYGVEPNLECYTCMVDLFGRAGHLERAVQVILEMPSLDYITIWLALLGACQKWGDVSVGRWAFEHAVRVDKSYGPAYVLMANIYAVAGMQENAKEIETMRVNNKAWKMPGRSRWVDACNDFHAFSVGDIDHTQINRIFQS